MRLAGPGPAPLGSGGGDRAGPGALGSGLSYLAIQNSIVSAAVYDLDTCQVWDIGYDRLPRVRDSPPLPKPTSNKGYVSVKQAWVPMKCGQSSQTMTAYFELTDHCWYLTSVTPAPAGQGRSHITTPMVGKFGISENYNGCLGCHADNYVRCGRCNELGCWNMSNPEFRCGWCGNVGPVSGSIESLSPADWG